MHRLGGSTKLLMVLCMSLAVMMGFDTRLLVVMLIVSVIFWKLSKISLRDLATVLLIVLGLMLLNNLFIFLFAPNYGTELYGTRHELVHLPAGYSITAEQLFYQLNVTLKYFAVIPIALLFLTTTEPSQFAAALNRVGVPYKVSYSVSLALRYIPDVQRDFQNISKAQQARGVDTSKDVSFFTRLKNTSHILFPLLLTSLDRIEVISTAMDLRGFGQGKKRTWYRTDEFTWRDVLALSISVLLLLGSIILLWVNGGRFYNPFM
ncbi:energy-coupling factor transporter transmembrane protein EcfT [Actinomycetaceae bacterium TAE3-ERU4]|nr:energy-coupling factor transporter transmembrane protein EcfT [Actinomycetaceae bacterium TAE3-ERU4]